MKLTPTAISGVVIIDLEPAHDDRGFFARSFDRAVFAEQGLFIEVVEMSVSFNQHLATLRGLHYQAEPHPDAKIVRCTGGAIFDVAVDLRADSPTYCHWIGTELSAANRRAVHIPTGCAHGFITLQDETEVSYIMGEAHHPTLTRGVRWNDPVIDVKWPLVPEVISERDRNLEDFKP